MKRLNNVELFPFKKLIDERLAESVMLAHLSVPAIDKKYPSSLSYKTVGKLLREEYNFDGITVTDALDMKGVLQDPTINVDLRSFEVGNDIISSGSILYIPEPIIISHGIGLSGLKVNHLKL